MKACSSVLPLGTVKLLLYVAVHLQHSRSHGHRNP